MINEYNLDEIQPIDADDIIDVSALDFTDDETWLHVSANCPPEGRTQNLHSWLKNGPEFDIEDNEGLNGARRSIDTRTFTRPKKRNNRMSFESIIEALSPPSAPNVWKKPPLQIIPGSNQNVEKESILANSRRDSVPAMLKQMPSLPVRSGMFGASGQESMEAFLNLSQSKGIDSFINLTEPEFADTIMNVSQPSELSSSLVDTTKESSANEGSIIDSQILTDSMMKTSMFGDISDIKDFNDETFLKDMENDTTLKKSNLNPEDDTLNINSQAPGDKAKLNSTFNTFTRRSATSLPRQSLPLEIEKQTINTTFIASPHDNKPDLEEMLIKMKKKDNKLANCFNGTYLSQKQTLETINVTLDLNSDVSEHVSEQDADIGSDFSSGENIHSSTTISQGKMNSTFNGPSDLRRELLAQVQRSTEANLDSTYSHVAEDLSIDVSVTNHHNTYKKNSSKFHDKRENKLPSLDLPTSYNNDRKYYTFTKKTNISEPKSNIESQASLENLDNTFCKPVMSYKKKLQAPRVLSRVPQLFQKSNPNLASNSLRNFDNNQRRSNIPNSKYARGGLQSDIPRNVEGSLINKLLPLGRYKSGSEQRLLDVGGSIKEFHSKGACGSTESIESTQSAHSAPDLDDRLSVCSDSSHTSYNSRVINSAQLHYIARLQEESLKQISTPKPNRRVLENNWVDVEKDLPSPIPKGESHEEQTLSRTLVKTSSPLSSPVGPSAQSLRTIGNHINDPTCQTAYQGQNNVAKKPEMLVRPMKHSGLENKTRLRAPTNWSAPNRGAGVGSGIPRPASRIPGPRISRPNYHQGNNQTDWKKGCL